MINISFKNQEEKVLKRSFHPTIEKTVLAADERIEEIKAELKKGPKKKLEDYREVIDKIRIILVNLEVPEHSYQRMKRKKLLGDKKENRKNQKLPSLGEEASLKTENRTYFI